MSLDLKKHAPSFLLNVFAGIVPVILFLLCKLLVGELEQVESVFLYIIFVFVVAFVISQLVKPRDRREVEKVNPDPREDECIWIWSSRDRVNPSFEERIRSAKTSLFFVGFSFETLSKDYLSLIREAIKRKIEVRLLFLNPYSDHAEAHQAFSDRRVRDTLLAVINDRLRPFYDSLDPHEKWRLDMRITTYLPRFAARIYDEQTMLLNFYLFNSKAHGNPVLEISMERNEEVFATIHGSLKELFELEEGKTSIYPPTYCLTAKGEWIGLKKEDKTNSQQSGNGE